MSMEGDITQGELSGENDLIQLIGTGLEKVSGSNDLSRMVNIRLLPLGY